MYRVRIGLLAGVSALALVAAQPEIASAADLPARPAMATKAPPATFHDRWSWWVEGGASGLAGDPGVAGLTGFDVDPKRWGWEAAIGFEYRPSMSPWIWSAQFRYGGYRAGSASNNPIATFAIAPTPTFFPVVAGNNVASRKEHHWVADFMVGRDLGLGQGRNTVRFGVRIAEIRGKTTGSANWRPIPASSGITCGSAPSYCGSAQASYEQKNSFLGVGPRLALDGQIPLGNHWAFEYGGGVAGLYGRRKTEQNVNISTVLPTGLGSVTAINCVAGCPINSSSSSNGFVFNADAMLGISYAITQNASLMVSYRFDGYWNALRGFDSNGSVTNLDRFYHGPAIRLTVTN
jgi:Legionella pneumophila major outer membrane protein precursor